MNIVKILFILLFLIFLNACSGGGESQPSQQQFSSLGRQIFFDESLSSPEGVSCASCHSSSAAFTDPAHTVVSKGAVAGRQGTRNSPTVLYAMFSPVFGFSEEQGDFVGGQFWDGKGRDLEAQARSPLFGHDEMNISSEEELRMKISRAPYAEEFKSRYGSETLNNASQTVSAVLDALSTFENSQEFQPFSSKYDAWAFGKATLSEQEQRGLALFNSPNKGNCSACHPTTGQDGTKKRALFTDFTYDNIGLPKNTLANKNADIGLYGTTGRPSDIGRFKVPTLRNVALTAPYFHNGVFATLKEAVHFYNSRDVDPKIQSPEFSANMNITELGNLGLSDQEEDDIVAFLMTLSDQ